MNSTQDDSINFLYTLANCLKKKKKKCTLYKTVLIHFNGAQATVAETASMRGKEAAANAYLGVHWGKRKE